MCKSAAGTHIFFGSATGPLELTLGSVPTRGGGVSMNASLPLLSDTENSIGFKLLHSTFQLKKQ
jgi:hypothetical protein